MRVAHSTDSVTSTGGSADAEAAEWDVGFELGEVTLGEGPDEFEGEGSVVIRMGRGEADATIGDVMAGPERVAYQGRGSEARPEDALGFEAPYVADGIGRAVVMQGRCDPDCDDGDRDGLEDDKRDAESFWH